MNIKSVQKINDYDNNLDNYKVILQDNSVCNVPLDPANTDYQAILEWVDAGNTIEEAD